LDKNGPTLKIGMAGKSGLIEDVAVEGADQANSNAQASQGFFFGWQGMFEGGNYKKCFRWECESYPETVGLRHDWLQDDE
jgi:hypothetical protein